MMHSTDKQLQLLLHAPEDSSEVATIAAHVESCIACQERIASLSGGFEWCEPVVQELRELGSLSEDTLAGPPLTRVELFDSVSDSETVDVESIPLDFLNPPSHPELLGKLGRYDVERLIGSGGMGVVLKAHDGELHRAVAVKVLAPHLAHSSAARRRFAREAQAAAAVLHPNVIPIFNVESDGRLPYLVMQYIAGPSLQARVDENGPLTINESLRIAHQTASGLAAAHAQGLIHRDVKPANILLEESVDRVVLSDFGLARTVDDASLTRTGIVTGTPHYMSPEQAIGDAIDCRSDQFGLGCVMYFMLAGRPPFRASSAMGVLNQICHHTHKRVSEINPEVPIEVADVIDRLLQKSPNDRFESMSELASVLEGLLAASQSGQLSLHTRQHSPLATGSGWPWRTISVATTLTVCAVLGTAAVWRNIPRPIASFNSAEPYQKQPSRVVVGQQGTLEQSRSAFGRSTDLFSFPSVETIVSNDPVSASLFRSTSDPWRQEADQLLDVLRSAPDPALSNTALMWLLTVDQLSHQEFSQLESDLNDVQAALNDYHSILSTSQSLPESQK